MTTSPTEERGPNKLIYNSWDLIAPEKIMGVYEFGSKNLTKILLFIKQGEFTREDYLYFHDLPVVRLEDEEYENYKVRRRFCQSLQKYKHQIQKMLMVNAMEKFMKSEQEKKDSMKKEILDNPTDINI